MSESVSVSPLEGDSSEELTLLTSNNQKLTRGLFLETTTGDPLVAPYTLKERDYTARNGKTYLSLKRLYLETCDPTEYRFACTHLTGLSHWEVLSSCTWFQDYLTAWRKELDLLLKSQALARIIRESKTSSRESFNANKYLLEKGWETTASKRGRPSKEEIKRNADDIFKTESILNADFQRLSPGKVN